VLKNLSDGVLIKKETVEGVEALTCPTVEAFKYPFEKYWNV
jgi:hypothetical protein